MSEAATEVERIARLSYGRLVGILTVRMGSLAAAEDAFAEALIRALETWPAQGVPDNPEGWLLKTARNRAIDEHRRAARADAYKTELEMLSETEVKGAEHKIDPRVKLMFACAHPAIDVRLRAPLMMQTVLGLDAKRIASVYLTSPGTLGQRLTRAKAKIDQTRVSFELPERQDEYQARLNDILAAIYAAYAIGANGLGSGDQKASNLAGEALWLIGTICAALPEEAEAHGLFALILYTESRRGARMSSETGALVPLQEQDPTLWNAEVIADADQALRNAQRNLSLGRFQLEASIQAVHMARRQTGRTDWAELRLLYKGLVQISPTLGALTGQAAVEAEAGDPHHARALLDAIPAKLRETYQPWFATYAHVLGKTGQREDARAAFDTALSLSNDPAEREYLFRQLDGA